MRAAHLYFYPGRCNHKEKTKISEKTRFLKFFQNFEVVFHHNQKRPKYSEEARFLYILKQKWRGSVQRFLRNPGFPENTRFHRFLGTHVLHGPRDRTWHHYLTSWFRFLTNWRHQKNWGTWLTGSQNTDTMASSIRLSNLFLAWNQWSQFVLRFTCRAIIGKVLLQCHFSSVAEV